jgi:anti-anti-sigma factor
VSNELLCVQWKQLGRQIVVHVTGEVDLATVPLLVQALSEAAAAPGAQWIAVDLTRVTFFGAIGLTALLMATRRGEATGIPVVVVTRPDHPAHRTITICQLQSELTIIDALGQLVQQQPRSTSAIGPSTASALVGGDDAAVTIRGWAHDVPIVTSHCRCCRCVY